MLWQSSLIKMAATAVKIIQVAPSSVAPSLLDTTNILPIPDDLDVKIRTKTVINELYPDGVQLPPTSDHMIEYDKRTNNFTYYIASTLNNLKTGDKLIIAYDFNIQKRGQPVYPSITLTIESVTTDRTKIIFKSGSQFNTGIVNREIITTPSIRRFLRSIDSINMRLPPGLTLGPRRKLTAEDMLLVDRLMDFEGEKMRPPVFIGTEVEFKAFLDTFELDIFRTNNAQSITTGFTPQSAPPPPSQSGGATSGNGKKYRIAVVFPFRE